MKIKYEKKIKHVKVKTIDFIFTSNLTNRLLMTYIHMNFMSNTLYKMTVYPNDILRQ